VSYESEAKNYFSASYKGETERHHLVYYEGDTKGPIGMTLKGNILCLMRVTLKVLLG
jgi:hypothetical protein